MLRMWVTLLGYPYSTESRKRQRWGSQLGQPSQPSGQPQGEQSDEGTARFDLPALNNTFAICSIIQFYANFMHMK